MDDAIHDVMIKYGLTFPEALVYLSGGKMAKQIKVGLFRSQDGTYHLDDPEQGDKVVEVSEEFKDMVDRAWESHCAFQRALAALYGLPVSSMGCTQPVETPIEKRDRIKRALKKIWEAP